MEIYWFDEDGAWVVAADGRVQRRATRGEAFAAARHLASQHAPSRLLRQPPPDWPWADPDEPSDPATDDVDARWAATVADAEAWDEHAGDDAPWDDAPWDDPRDGAGPQPTRPAPQPARRPAARPASHAGGGPPPHPSARPAGPVDWDRLAGPAALGRSVVVVPGQQAPAPWAGAERLAVDPATADAELLARVRTAFLSRTPLVVELPVDAVEPATALTDVDVWALPVDHELTGDAVWQLVWSNALDARHPERPRWAWAELAAGAGARWPSAPDDDPGVGDVVLADGTPAWCDGGPLASWPAEALGAPVLAHVAIERGVLTPDTGAPPTAVLAPDQLAAVGEAGACSRIVAPAGSGKTRVLTERARHLLGARHLPADALCLVAFNKRAQREMQERTADLPGLQVQTLNALALAVLNGDRGFADRGERVRTIDELAVRRLIDELVTLPRRANTDPAVAWIDALSAVRLGLRHPAEVELDFGGDVDGLPEVVDRFRRALRTQGVVDFDDQIYRAIEVLLAEPGTRRQAQRVCRLLLVDEFQDLTPAHLLLIRLLAGPEQAVFGVGDDDQTIYGYSGASPDWLVGYDRFFPGATHHALEVNYRCPEPVVTAATNLLSRNEHRVAKVITAGRPDVADPLPGGELAEVRVAEPVEATLARITALLEAGAAPADIVVLARVNALLAPVQVALHEQGIPAANSEGARFVERTGVAAALSWLALATSGTRGYASGDVQRAARRPGRGLSPKLVEWMSEQRDVRGLTRLAERLSTERDADKVLGFAGDLERLTARARRAPTAELLEAIRAEVGLDKAMSTLDAAHRGRNATAHADDLRALIALGRLHPEPTTFAAWLRHALATPPDPGGIQLATVHKVKGLEWPHVIVYDATQGLFPHHLSTDVEEERRVFHVALTRAQRSVLLVADAARPSMFLDELAAPAPPRPSVDSPSGPDRVAAGDDRRRDGGRRGGGGRSGGGRGGGGDRPEVAAELDLELSWGGYDGTVVEIRDDGITLAVGKARLEVPFGSEIAVERRRATLMPARPTGRRGKGQAAATGADELDAADTELLESLKAWRSVRSRADKVPAYVVATDATLVAIAASRPTTEAELLAVPGIGPSKLERYGDEILAVVDA